MFWIGIAVLVIVGWIIYSKRKGSVIRSVTKSPGKSRIRLIGAHLRATPYPWTVFAKIPRTRPMK